MGFVWAIRFDEDQATTAIFEESSQRSNDRSPRENVKKYRRRQKVHQM